MIYCFDKYSIIIYNIVQVGDNMEIIMNILINSLKTNVISTKDITKIINIFADELDTKKYIKKVIFKTIDQDATNHKSNNCFIAYDPINYHIYMDIKKTNEYINQIFNSDMYKGLNEFEKLFVNRVFLVNALFHEVEHANQIKMSCEHNNNFEGILFKKILFPINSYRKFKIFRSLNNKVINYNNVLIKYDNNSLEERLANIKSYNYTLKLLKLIKPYVPNLIKIFEKKKLKALIKGYNFKDNISNPTDRYIYDLVNHNVLSKNDLIEIRYLLMNFKNANINTRLMYGLSVDEFDIDYIKNKIV